MMSWTVRSPSTRASTALSRGPSPSPASPPPLGDGPGPDPSSTIAISSSISAFAGRPARPAGPAAAAARSKTTSKFGIFFSRIGHSSIIRTPSMSTSSAGIGA